jgi:hypothetical protein
MQGFQNFNNYLVLRLNNGITIILEPSAVIELSFP